ncbi:MAG: hypothetical protein HZA49_02800 [Planctomycetes bacterium]|nr:hypothetical protein [Planctomycetota bacterium]
MLVSINTGKVIRRIPHRAIYNLMRKRLSDDEFNAVKKALNQMIDDNEILTAGVRPLHNPFRVIYKKAARRNNDDVSLMFGLIVWVVFMERGDTWSFGRYEKDKMPIQKLTYFRVSPNKALNKPDKLAPRLYFYGNLTMKEIGRVLNISESRVSRILVNAVNHRRKRCKRHK